MEYKEEYNFKCNTGKTIVTIEDNKYVSIARPGINNFFYHGMKGTKKIKIDKLTSIQIREGDRLTNGYIQFTFVGSSDNKRGLLSAHYDENSIVFSRKYNEVAKRLVHRLEELME